MPCRAVENWSVTSLVGAYLDLALAYLFLVGATIAFFASKLLSVAGLSLPCSCDGRFGHPACAQTSLLLDFPTATIATVHRSLRSRLPFDSLFFAGASSSGCLCAAGRSNDDANSCRSVSSLSAHPLTDSRLEEPLAQINGTRSRSSVGGLISDLEKPRSASAERFSGGPWDSEDDEIRTGLEEEAEAGEEKDSLSGVVGWEKKGGLAPLRSMERVLQEEREARAALYLDLEKERSAAASAADEAMAMILRLQKEKAEIGMEARQYQRMIEEKYAYDAEEMKILKEIIVGRERERHVLEKEVQMYKQMMNSGGSIEQASDTYNSVWENRLDNLVDSSDDPVLVLQQIYNSIGKKEDFGADSSPVCSDHDKYVDVNTKFQEKGMLTSQSEPCLSDNLNFFNAKESVLRNLSTSFEAEYLNDNTELNVSDGDERDTLFHTKFPSEGLHGFSSDDADKECNESSQFESESNILDVHAIDEDQVLQITDNNNLISVASKEESFCKEFDEMELNIRRSCSEITNSVSLIDHLPGRASYFNLKSSLPSVETERCKLENEVESLKNRLENIKNGREKLSLYPGQKVNETFQLHLLSEIPCQLREIKKVIEPNKNLPRASIPPPYSKFQVNSSILWE